MKKLKLIYCIVCFLISMLLWSCKPDEEIILDDPAKPTEWNN